MKFLLVLVCCVLPTASSAEIERELLKLALKQIKESDQTVTPDKLIARIRGDVPNLESTLLSSSSAASVVESWHSGRLYLEIFRSLRTGGIQYCRLCLRRKNAPIYFRVFDGPIAKEELSRLGWHNISEYSINALMEIETGDKLRGSSEDAGRKPN